VVAAGGEAYLVLGDPIVQSVFVGDPSRPVTVEAVLQGFRLADSLAAVPLDIVDEYVDPLKDSTVLGLSASSDTSMRSAT
jgi:hypothetical protein